MLRAHGWIGVDRKSSSLGPFELSNQGEGAAARGMVAAPWQQGLDILTYLPSVRVR